MRAGAFVCLLAQGMAEALEKEVHWEWLKDVLLQPCGFGGVVAVRGVLIG